MSSPSERVPDPAPPGTAAYVPLTQPPDLPEDPPIGPHPEWDENSEEKCELPVKPRRPISYPCGPENKPENQPNVPGFDPAKRNSDPPKPVSVPGQKVKAQVKPFTKESLERLERKTVQLVREYGFQPRRKLSVEDGSRLPSKYEPFPSKLYGRPLEEIDNFIYDEASVSVLFRTYAWHGFDVKRPLL